MASQGLSVEVNLNLPPATPPYFLSANHVWLADAVPPEFIAFPG